MPSIGQSAPPYFLSPTRGSPREANWIRIWWVRPFPAQLRPQQMGQAPRLVHRHHTRRLQAEQDPPVLIKDPYLPGHPSFPLPPFVPMIPQPHALPEALPPLF